MTEEEVEGDDTEMKYLVKATHKSYPSSVKEVFSFDNEEDARQLSETLSSISSEWDFSFTKDGKPCESNSASNYYFYAGDSDENNCVCVVIVNIDYWNKNHHLDDHHLGIQDILPSGISEEAESLFFSNMTLKGTKDALRKAGFKEDKEFSSFSMNGDPFGKYDIPDDFL